MNFKKLFGTTALVAIAFTLSACNASQRLSEIGDAPPLSAVATPLAMPVSFPVPSPDTHVRQANSLWQPGARAFFKDQRAAKVGDIMTVIVQVTDKIDMKNETTRQRNTNESDEIGGILGLNNLVKKVLPYPSVVDPNHPIDLSGTTNNEGKAKITREDKINMRVAAVVTQVLPNGNMVIYGKQEMVMNYDLRELKVAGVIRPEDISSANSINYDQIAEARITYGGRGQMMDVQQPRYGQQLLDIVYPF